MQETDTNKEQQDFYANSAQVTTSLYDVILHFRLQTPLSIEKEQAMIESKNICVVRMSPQHAKSVAALLVKHIVKYEEDNKVKLPLPPDIQKVWDEHCK